MIQGACVWGSICNASAGMGKFVPDAYGDFAVGDFRAAGFENPRAERPEGRSDLGRHARRQSFQRAVSARKISAAREHQDGEHRRLRRAAQGAARRRGRGREPAAATDRDGRAARACARSSRTRSIHCGGCRRISIRRSCTAICARSTAPRRRWTPTREIPAAVEARGAVRVRDHHKWDFSKFGRGERFVYKTLPQSEFDEVMEQVKRWGLDQYLKDQDYEHLSCSTAP